jgi:hypothetical protein
VTSEAVLQAVRAWCMAVLSLPAQRVRVGPSNGVVGSTAYVTVTVEESEEVWHTEQRRTYPTTAGVATVTPTSTRAWTVRIEGWGPGSRALLDALSLRARVVDTAGAALRAAGVHPFGGGAVRQIPSLLTTAWVERARLDLPCYADLTAGTYTATTAADLVLQSEGRTPVIAGKTITVPLETP